jgi:signal transduction histidine kinase
VPDRLPTPRWRPGLRLLFVVLGLLVLLLAGGGLLLFRAYDNQLVRATEAELLSQGAFVSARFREAIQAERIARGRQSDPYGVPINPRFQSLHTDPPTHISARLDLWTDSITPSTDQSGPSDKPADAIATVAGNAITPILMQGTAVSLSGIRVVDFQGIVVASSRGELGHDRSGRDEIRRALAGEYVHLLRSRVSDSPAPAYSSISRGTGVRVLVAMPVVVEGRAFGAVILSRTPMSLGKAFYQDRYNLMVMAGVLILAVIIVSFLAAAFILRPVGALLRQIRAVAAGDVPGTRPLVHPGTREIQELSTSLSLMSEQLRQRADYIRGFVAAVSHEFKTPLASIRGTVELLAEHGESMDVARRTKFLANLDEDAKRLDRQVKALLDLARADMLAPRDENTDLGPLLRKLAGPSGEAFTLALPDPPTIARISPEALSAVLSTVIDNAQVHGGKRVDLRVEREGDWIHIHLHNDGPGISAGNAARVFEPFFTTARDRGGTGMGLTIARALLRAHTGDIDLLPSEKGAHFRVSLRSANGESSRT